MTRKPIRFLTAFLLAATPITPLLAGGGPHGRPFGGDGPMLSDGMMERHAEHQAERLTRALDLTAAQQETLARLQDELETTIRPLGEAMRTAHEQLRALLDGNAPDPAAVGTQAIAIDRGRDGIEAARKKFEADFAATLTEAQRAIFRALREMRPEGERFGGRLGPGGQARPRP